MVRSLQQGVVTRGSQIVRGEPRALRRRDPRRLHHGKPAGRRLTSHASDDDRKHSSFQAFNHGHHPSLASATRSKKPSAVPVLGDTTLSHRPIPACHCDEATTSNLDVQSCAALSQPPDRSEVPARMPRSRDLLKLAQPAKCHIRLAATGMLARSCAVAALVR